MKKYYGFGYLTAIAGLMLWPAAAQDNETSETQQSDEASFESERVEVDEELEAELADLEKVMEFERKLSDPKELLNIFALKKPLIELPIPETDRLVIANRITSRLFPVGTNERVVRTMMNDLIRPMIDRTLELNLVEAIDLFGIDEDVVPRSADIKETSSFGELIAEVEPDYREKMDAVFDAYIEISGLVSEPIEPALADAMARDYARKYNLAQLNDLDMFFSTPTGALFAKDFMTSTVSVDMVQTVFQEFPAIAENSDRIQEITENIEKILKPSVNDTIIEDDCEDCNIEDDETDPDDNIITSDLGDEPWFEKENWNEKSRRNVQKLSDNYNKLAESSEQAYTEYDDAYNAALNEARAKYIADGWTRENRN